MLFLVKVKQSSRKKKKKKKKKKKTKKTKKKKKKKKKKKFPFLGEEKILLLFFCGGRTPLPFDFEQKTIDKKKRIGK